MCMNFDQLKNLHKSINSIENAKSFTFLYLMKTDCKVDGYINVTWIGSAYARDTENFGDLTGKSVRFESLVEETIFPILT